MSVISLFLKGIVIGFFMLFPGVSGGSIAIIFSEYDNIIFNTSNIFKETKKPSRRWLFWETKYLMLLLVSKKMIYLVKYDSLSHLW